MALAVLLGGARSGKSTLALRRAETSRRPVVFIATAEARDAEMSERIKRHRSERSADWTTVEEPLDLRAALTDVPSDACAIVDCLSLWVANLIGRGDGESAIIRLAAETADQATRRDSTTIAVSNEVGMGVVPAYEAGRRYRDLLGRVNAIWVDRAAEAVLVVAGRPLRLGTVDGS